MDVSQFDLVDDNKIISALHLACDAHKGQLRKVNGAPFIVHLFDVLKFLKMAGASVNVCVAGVLHDVIEDTPLSVHDLSKFGDEVVSLVLFCSEIDHDNSTSDKDLHDSWKRRKEHTIISSFSASGDELLVELADKLSNLSSIRDDLVVGFDVWSHFNAPKSEIRWYYSELGSIFRKRFPDSPLVKLYDNAFDEVFS